jgi:uncharacterized protein DUF4255
MLNDLDESLKALLVQDLPRVTERIEPDGFDVRFDVPNRDFRSRLTRPTLCLYLYNIQQNRDLRGRTWTVSRRDGSVATRRPPVRLDCSYMVTAWSNEVEDEHRLLTGAARVLFRNPILPPEILQGGLIDGIDITTEVAQPEAFKDVVDIWSVLDNDLHPSVRVTVTIPLEVDVEYESPPVHSNGAGLSGPGWRPPRTTPSRIEARVERDGKPVPDVLVRVDYSSDRTNERGEFVLDKLKPGRQLVYVQVDGTFLELEADLTSEPVLELPSAVPPGGEAATGPTEPKKGG